jgi:hypothetical protein
MDQEKSSFVAQTDAVVHVYRSSGRVYAIRDWGGGTIALAAALPLRRGDRRVVSQSVRLSGCGAGPSASRAAPTIAGELPRPAKPRSPSGARTPGSGFRLARPPAGHDGTGHARCHRQSIRQGASIEDRNSSRETASGAIVVGHVSVKNVRTQ